jgi:predicted TIM-barrel enzyme
MKQYSREQVLERLKAKLATGNIIVAAGAGTGISAKFEEEGGADLILVFNSGRYRMHGLGSLSGWLRMVGLWQCQYHHPGDGGAADSAHRQSGAGGLLN